LNRTRQRMGDVMSGQFTPVNDLVVTMTEFRRHFHFLLDIVPRERKILISRRGRVSHVMLSTGAAAELGIPSRNVRSSDTYFTTLYLESLHGSASLRSNRAHAVKRTAAALNMSVREVCRIVGISATGIGRKVRTRGTLNKGETTAILRLARLIGQAEEIGAEASPGTGFDSPRWLGSWLRSSHPGLGGLSPSDVLRNKDGFDQVSQLLAQQQSSAYA
jgi:uncharacterized protein (DUF2384 family)